MLERQRGQYFDAHVVGDEVLKGDGRLDVAVDLGRQGAQAQGRAIQVAGIGLGIDRVNADAQGPVALGLGHGGSGDQGHGGSQAGDEQGGRLAHVESVAWWRWRQCPGAARMSL
ncbi:hypothetical protein D9M71_619280 [compost metagenome]